MSNVENPNFNSLLYIISAVETGHTIVFLIVIDISYPLMITVLEFMCSYYFVVFIQTGCVFSEFGCVANIHISTEVYRQYNRRLRNPSRCGSCLDIVVSCG